MDEKSEGCFAPLAEITPRKRYGIIEKGYFDSIAVYGLSPPQGRHRSPSFKG
jgi:hypothetical protein